MGAMLNPNGAADQPAPKNPFLPLQRRLQVRPVAGRAPPAAAAAACRWLTLPCPAASLRVCHALQYFLDKSTPHVLYRWLALAGVLLVYVARVFFLQGFFIVTYALGIFNLNLFLGFLTPRIDPEADGPSLPSKSSEEFRPFVRRLPEFKFWCVGGASGGGWSRRWRRRWSRRWGGRSAAGPKGRQGRERSRGSARDPLCLAPAAPPAAPQVLQPQGLLHGLCGHLLPGV